jgi:PAS domain S-box-containing protein
MQKTENKICRTRGETLARTNLELSNKIAELIAVEQTLRASEILYRRLFETAKDGIFLLDAETGHITEANPYLVDLLGYSHDELVGKKLWEIGPFKDIEASRSAFQELQQREYIHYEDLPLKAKDGQRVEVEFVSNVYTVGEKKVIQCNIREISQRKRAEEKLRESEERYRELFENANDIVYTHDLAGDLTSVNRMGEQISGYTRDEILKMNITQIVAPEHLDRVRQMVADATSWVGATTCELEIVTRDHERVMLEVSSRLVWQKRKPVAVQGIARDVTGRKTLEDQLRQAQKIEAIGKLAGGVAHDFNNILTAIIGHADLMLKEPGQGSERTLSGVQAIKNAAERAAGLTQQLLAFSRKQVLRPVILNLNAMISESMKMLRPVITEHIQLALVLDPALGSMKADPGQIEQVIVNLVVNARDAMPQGGKLTIETARVNLDDAYARQHASVRPGHYVMLAVSDTGSGMNADAQAHIFEPFFTTKGRGKGTGLGLSTVYGIVKQSGGSIWVSSERGEGTAFKIYFPCVDQPAEEVATRAQLTESPGGSETILVVEDEEMVRRLVCQILTSKGYRVLEAANGEEGLLVCKRQPFPIHIMVTDVVMPEMNGRDLANRVAAIRPAMKVLFMSGYSEDAVVRDGVLDPGLNFIQKPFAPEALAWKVREVLGRSVTSFAISGFP